MIVQCQKKHTFKEEQNIFNFLNKNNDFDIIFTLDDLVSLF